ncbi:alpha/beta fold hydrolase [Nocardioides sp. zg-DK7169]|uniref:alpha/beta fold hydrolase n=1 Tax=Nocardioides sp. zg-DK7169 TaxID=2736600 RepID=UPI0015560BD9|nr:alpha/beta hydrolase [Nocardioides sp. zg-DK7169]NPC97010.1 alpha/beta hydrolase [Nocardioides sp. zg-DK7169]
MTTFALVHGSGDGGWAWDHVARALRRRGHEAVAPDLPTDREDATWADCVDVVAQAVGVGDGPVGGRTEGNEDVVVVGHSSGAFVASLAATRLGAAQVFVAAMVPRPGESAQEWFDAVGWGAAVAAGAHEDGGRTGSTDPMVAYFHDVAPGLAREAVARERPTSDVLGEVPWPGPGPAVPARYVVTTLDRFLPPALQREVARTRLGIEEPETIGTGHCAHLSRPDELADLLAPSGAPGAGLLR